jgi:two-component system, NarL family, response regulator DesR
VLIVDDDARVRLAIAQTIALEADLCLLGAIGDAAGAVTLAERTAPDVAVVDVLLPDPATGLEVIADLAATGCAVVAISLRGGVRDRALAAGATSFIEKSDVDGLLAHVRAAALRHSTESHPAA